MFAYLNGQYIPRSTATISVEDRGFVFGDGVYEVWRVVNGTLFETERHLDRLAFGLNELRIVADDIVRPDVLNPIAKRLLVESGFLGGEATFYLEVTRGVAPRTHQFPSRPTNATVYATVNRFMPPEDLRLTGASCITIPDIRWQRCDIKTIQLLPNVLAKQAAVERGAVDAIMIRNGVATEGSHANVFAVVDGVLRTHPTDHHILAGVTRAVVLELARDAGIPTLEEPLTEAELASADELFLAGTTTDVMPIVRLNDAIVGSGQPGPITTRLVREFRVCLDVACGVVSTT